MAEIPEAMVERAAKAKWAYDHPEGPHWADASDGLRATSRHYIHRVLKSADVGELVEIIRDFLEVAPAFRSKPYGAPHSAARETQERHIALEDRARVALAKATGSGS